MRKEEIKKRVGYLAADWVKEGSILGIGTGSTVRYFIDRLGERCRQGLGVQVLCSSLQSYDLVRKKKISLAEEKNIKMLDLTVDGADEVDAQYRMIKGGGGALLREKMLAYGSRKMVIIVDYTKRVEQLGKRKLPLEILPFAYSITIEQIKKRGFRGKLRKNKDATFYRTDNGNLIYDVLYTPSSIAPEEAEQILINIPGVVETGFFFDAATDLLLGCKEGMIKHIEIERQRSFTQKRK